MRNCLATVSAAIVVLALSATGCASAASQPATPATPKKSAMRVATLTTTTDAVLADAAKVTGVDKTAVTVVSTETVVWADGSLGCPAPGMSYTMAQVTGYRIRVRAGKRELDYHADQRGHYILCAE